MGKPLKKESLYFLRQGRVAVVEEEVRELLPHEALVATDLSAISAGTELLFYREQVPPSMLVDESIGGLQEPVRYPLKYGYACVGHVRAVGEEVPKEWEGRRVFALHPHESSFVASAEDLVLLPPDLPEEDAVFLPMMETAVNLMMDAAPSVGEKVVVFGQGIVGLTATALLRRYPLGQLVTVDKYALRRERSREWGADVSLDPSVPGIQKTLLELLGKGYRGADLCLELSGEPAVLDSALAACGFSGRIVIGSWYGEKKRSVDLGGSFHRNRQRIISSQVSTIDPRWSGRWTKERRRATALRLLEEIRPSSLISHRFPLYEAHRAYTLLNERPEEALQVILTYGK